MLDLPTRFFTTCGQGTSSVAELNAFDQALIDAGIGEQNLVPVSSVLPEGIERIDRPDDLPRGAITHCVLAEQRGTEGETISAGIAWGFREDGAGGYVAEGHGHMRADAMREILEWKLDEIARKRDVGIKTAHYEIEELTIPMDHYGVGVAALVFLK